ncbi:MAG: hypothetical protein R6X02_13440 [Enhygromyxa sp.]
MTRPAEFLRPAALLIAAVVGLTLGACGHSDYRIDKVCKRYCDRVLDCNDNADWNDCYEGCVDTAHDCDSDKDVESALDILEDECTPGACNKLGGCSIEAWLECKL